MLFLMGPRQVGKTTTARQAAAGAAESVYLNWDSSADRQLVLAGQEALARRLGLERLRDRPVLCVLDELHKHRGWKNFLKGFFDTHGAAVQLLVTGSARLDVFRAGGDSLMGRYFPLRMHPLSVGELTRSHPAAGLVDGTPRRLDEDQFAGLLRFGGFPEPFLRADDRFFRRWRRLRTQQLLKEELRDLTRVQELGQIEMLAELLRQRVGQPIRYALLSREIGVAVDTVRRWVRILESLYFCFTVRPWFRNVARSLRKEPKIYLWDWSHVPEPGPRAENLVASALLKAVHLWTDAGHGAFELCYLRDKQQHEVDFAVVRDGQPWFLAEVKTSGGVHLSGELARFQRQIGAPHAFQVALDLPFVERDCFETAGPLIVPARTLLAQLP